MNLPYHQCQASNASNRNNINRMSDSIRHGTCSVDKVAFGIYLSIALSLVLKKNDLLLRRPLQPHCEGHMTNNTS